MQAGTVMKNPAGVSFKKEGIAICRSRIHYPTCLRLWAKSLRKSKRTMQICRSHKVLLSLGSNLGKRKYNILKALQYIRARASISRISSLYETEPVGYLNQPRFLNIACMVDTELSAKNLLHFLKSIEKRLGRQQSFRNAPRLIDIDIIFYENLSLDEHDLTIPHPRMQERAFVLVPLAEISPNWMHPLLKMSVRELLGRVSQRGVCRVGAVEDEYLKKN